MLNPDTNARSNMYIEKNQKKETRFSRKTKMKNWENEKMNIMKKCKKKEVFKVYPPETAKKTNFQHLRKEKEKKKHESDVTLKWATPNSLSTGAQKSYFQLRKSSFLQ